MKRIFFGTFLYFSFSFSAIIGVVGSQKGDPHIAEYLSKELAPLGHRVQVAWQNDDLDSFDLIFASNYKSFLNPYRKKTIFSCYEPEVIIHQHSNFKRLGKFLGVMTWNHDICRTKGFVPFYYPTTNIEHPDGAKPKAFNERRLVCMINSYLKRNHGRELYSTRLKIAYFYRNRYPDQFELYGRNGWSNDLRPVYKGGTDNKPHVLRNHKFCYAYENWDNGYHYISEKIFEVMNELCVPIYLGSRRITDYVPEECFIDARKFSSIQEIHDYISNMDEERYMEYIRAIIKYSRSEKRKLFTPEYYKKSALELIKSKL